MLNEAEEFNLEFVIRREKERMKERKQKKRKEPEKGLIKRRKEDGFKIREDRPRPENRFLLISFHLPLNASSFLPSSSSPFSSLLRVLCFFFLLSFPFFFFLQICLTFLFRFQSCGIKKYRISWANFLKPNWREEE